MKGKILIVDDDLDDREILRDAFTASGSDRECAFLENGERLLAYLNDGGSEEPPALIMLDLNMPGKDGRETLRELKSMDDFATIPVVVFTTSSSHRDRLTAYQLGANLFLTKPDTFNKLTDLTAAIQKLWL